MQKKVSLRGKVKDLKKLSLNIISNFALKPTDANGLFLSILFFILSMFLVYFSAISTDSTYSYCFIFLLLM